MAALGLLVRRSLRSRARAIAGLALVIAMAGGVAMTAVAAARRTASAFPRYLEASEASDFAMNVTDRDGEERTPADEVLEVGERAARLPNVVATASYIGLETVVLTDADGEFLPVQPEVLGSLDGRFIEQDRAAVLEGRLPRAAATREVMVNRQMAEVLDLRPGSVLHVAVYPLSALEAEDPSTVDPLTRLDARVSGVGQLPSEVLGDDVDASSWMLVTPAMTREFRGVAGTYIWQGLRLRPGTDVDHAIAEYQRLLLPNQRANIQRSDVQLDRVQRAVRPVAVALGAFGVAAALAALALGGLGLVRLVGGAGAGARTLRALGLRPAAVTLAMGMPGLVALGAGALGAVALSILLSPLGPVGPVRAVDPERGIDVDLTVLLAGLAVLVVVLSGVAVLSARRAVRADELATAGTARPSRLVRAVAALGLRPAAVVGARHAIGTEGRRGGPPSRSTLAACTVSIAAIAAALTFGASVRSLLDSPASYGWAASAAVQSGGGYDEIDPHALRRAAQVDGVSGLTAVGFGRFVAKDQRITALGFEAVEGDPAITLVRGALPARADEVALGASTARGLHVSVGDELRTDAGRLRVTGIAALPAVGPISSAHPSLGQGAVLTFEGLARQSEGAYLSMAFVDVEGDLGPVGRMAVDLRTTGQRSAAQAFSVLFHHPAEMAEVYPLLRPAEVTGMGPATRTANLLAGALGAAAVLALVLTLGSSVRRRATTFAVLAALGFDRHDLRRTVRWQTNLVTALALLVGLPVGVALGRLAWTAFADDLGAAAGPVVPLGLLALVGVALLVLANATGEWPARLAARAPARALTERR